MAANSFLSGFTGGMGAVSQVMNYQEQRQQRQQQLQDQQMQRNVATMMHIDQSFGDNKEGRQKYRQGMFQGLNENQHIKSALALEHEDAEISGLEVTAAGFVPIISYPDPDNPDKKITRPVMMEGENQPLAIGQEDFFRAIGSQPDLLDRSVKLQAKLLGSGGSLPERSERYQQETINGGLYNRNLKTNELKAVSGGGGSRSGSSSGSGSAANPRTLLKRDEDGHQVQYTMEDGHVIRTEWPTDGKPVRSDVTNDWNNIKQSGNVADRMGLGGGDGGNHLAVDTRPFYEWGTGTGGEAESEEEEDKPTEKPKDRPKRTPVTPGSLDTGYGGFKVPREQMERAESARSEDIAGLANLVRQQQKNSQLGQQNMANARTHYGGMINPQSPQQQVAKPENAKSEKGQIEQVYDEVERIISGGGTEKELTEYLSQFDDSVTRKVQQMRINAGKLVSDRGVQQ